MRRLNKLELKKSPELLRGILRLGRKDCSWGHRVETSDGVPDDVRHDSVVDFSIHHAAVAGVAGKTDRLKQSTLQQGPLAAVVVEHAEAYRCVGDLVGVVVPGHGRIDSMPQRRRQRGVIDLNANRGIGVGVPVPDYQPHRAAVGRDQAVDLREHPVGNGRRHPVLVPTPVHDGKVETNVDVGVRPPGAEIVEMARVEVPDWILRRLVRGIKTTHVLAVTGYRRNRAITTAAAAATDTDHREQKSEALHGQPPCKGLKGSNNCCGYST